MSKGPTETTDRMYPPPENPNPDAPIPLTQSIRVAFNDHRKGTNETLGNFALRLQALEAQTLKAAPQSILGAVKGGVIKAGKLTPLILIIGEAVASVASELGHQTWVGPIRFILSLFGG